MQAYRDLLGRYFPDLTFGVSQEPGHEYVLADQALEEGYDLLVAVGGDGTWSHVADRIVSSGREDVALGVLPSGTGNDFGRNLGLSYRDPEDAVARLAGGRPVPVDVGRINTPSVPAEAGTSGSDTRRVRHFINVVGIGFDVAVVDAAAGARFLKGELLYKATALQQLFRFPGLNLSVRDGGDFQVHRAHLMMTVTNGAFFGGGFPIAPGAEIDDGLLHACLIGDASPMRRMRLFGRAEKGRHVTEPEVETRTARRFTVEAGEPVRFEADGDIYETGVPELDLELLPGALLVVGS
jgi:diacylglycerol kinase (ATP)